MRAEALVNNLREAVRNNVAAMIHGSPGCGKSDIVKQLAKDEGLSILDYRLSQVDAVDLRGVPSIKDGKTQWNVPAEFPAAGKGILFLDEINSAPQSVQAAAYQLVLDRQLGTYELPPGWIPIAAGNRVTDRAIVNQMPTPLRNRFIHFNLETSIDDWSNWAVTHGIHEQTIAFLRFRPNLLDEFANPKDAAQIKDANAFCTPRSWATADKFVKSGNRLSMMSSAVGEGPAAEFEAYLRVYDELPDLDLLLTNVKKYWKPIKNPGANYAVSTGIAARCQGDDKIIKPFFEVVDLLPVEFGMLAVKDAERRNPNVLKNPTFFAWCKKNIKMFAG